MKYEPMAGEWVGDAAERMVSLAAEHSTTVEAEFNGITLRADPGSTADQIVRNYNQESERRRLAYEASPEYAQRQREAEERDRKRQEENAAALAVAPASMSLRDPEGWQRTVDANSDPYGSAAVRYAETWARIMEGLIAQGQSVSSCAEHASHIADTEGITGFMYGCAVSILAKVWTHGEELRQWHNLKSQLGNEGERANANGGVLNPAILVAGEE